MGWRGLFLIVFVVCGAPAQAEPRLLLTHAYEWQETQPLYQRLVHTTQVAMPAPLPSPLRLHGSTAQSPNDRTTLAPSTTDRLSRLSEQRMVQAYGNDGWETTTLDGELRFAQAQHDRGVLTPFITGGVALTQFDTPAATAETPTATGWRYGGGVAYGIGDMLDFTAGYRVNQMEASTLGLASADRLSVHMLDVGLTLRY